MADIEPYVVVVTCVVVGHGADGTRRALVLKRSDDEKEGPGLWTIPGGKMERADWGEPTRMASHSVWKNVLARAMAREIGEETGIAVSPHECIFSAGEEVVFIRKNGMPTLVFRFILPYREIPVVRLGGESTEYRWVTEEELDAYSFIGNVREEIRKVLREPFASLC